MALKSIFYPPSRSYKLSNDVVPMIGAVTPKMSYSIKASITSENTQINSPGLLMIQANDSWAMLTPFAFATSSTRLMISWVKGLSVVYPFWALSVSFRLVTSVKGLQRSPRAIGDQGMEATLNHWGRYHIRASVNGADTGIYIESREHLTFFFTVDEVVMVLHWYEGCELVVDSVVCDSWEMKSRVWLTDGTYSA